MSEVLSAACAICMVERDHAERDRRAALFDPLAPGSTDALRIAPGVRGLLPADYPAHNDVAQTCGLDRERNR